MAAMNNKNTSQETMLKLSSLLNQQNPDDQDDLSTAIEALIQKLRQSTSELPKDRSQK